MSKIRFVSGLVAQVSEEFAKEKCVDWPGETAKSVLNMIYMGIILKLINYMQLCVFLLKILLCRIVQK